MAVVSGLMTVAEFMNLPEPAGGLRQELHHGELFEMPPVKAIHVELQDALVEALSQLLGPAFKVSKEFPFQPLPEHEVWSADVAVLTRSRWKSTPRDSYFAGVPTIAIEVLSPSNTASEMFDRERMCLSNGGQEFWVLDPKRQTIKVTTSGGRTRSYGLAEEIPLECISTGSSLSIARIFGAESQLS